MTSPDPSLLLHPIGFVHSPWRDKRDAPRQPAEARGVPGQIELHARAELQDALADLECWSHIWVLFWFHRNESFRAKVQAPRSSKKRGVFSTRSPYRPNPLGLSVLRLERVSGHILHVRDLDLLDGTPVLDIKPYVAYTDAIVDANAGWLDDRSQSVCDVGLRYAVEFGERACQQLAWLEPRARCDVRALAQSVLAAGPTPHAYRRIRVRDGYSELAVKDFRVHFRVVESQPKVIHVFEITTGYRDKVLADPNAEPKARGSELTPLSVHREFAATFEVRDLLEAVPRDVASAQTEDV
jgi:tRNA-Thr(GGU) m(6)t(6)A37 methyltransferase TsaA